MPNLVRNYLIIGILPDKPYGTCTLAKTEGINAFPIIEYLAALFTCGSKLVFNQLSKGGLSAARCAAYYSKITLPDVKRNIVKSVFFRLGVTEIQIFDM